MLTIDEIRKGYCPGITEEQLARFREQSRIAKGPPFRMTIEMPPPDLSPEEGAEALAHAEYDDDAGNFGAVEGTYIKLKARNGDDAKREAESIWLTQPDKAAVGYAIWSADWGCVHSFRVDRDSR